LLAGGLAYRQGARSQERLQVGRDDDDLARLGWIGLAHVLYLGLHSGWDVPCMAGRPQNGFGMARRQHIDQTTGIDHNRWHGASLMETMATRDFLNPEP
jgi:hypothetical protein